MRKDTMAWRTCFNVHTGESVDWSWRERKHPPETDTARLLVVSDITDHDDTEDTPWAYETWLVWQCPRYALAIQPTFGTRTAAEAQRVTRQLCYLASTLPANVDSDTISILLLTWASALGWARYSAVLWLPPSNYRMVPWMWEPPAYMTQPRKPYAFTLPQPRQWIAPALEGQ